MQTKRKASNKTMKVTLLQTDIEWENQQTNIRNAQSMIEQAEPSDLYVLPEMWTTGFTMKPQELPGDEGLAWMKQTARQRKCAICGSIATRGSDRRFITAPSLCIPMATTTHMTSVTFLHTVARANATHQARSKP